MWLLNRIKNQTANIVILSNPTGLAMDDQSHLAVVYNANRLQLMYSNLTTIETISTATNSRPLSYQNSYYFVGIYPVISPYTLYMYSATNLTLVSTTTNIYGSPQRVAFVYNNSIMCVITQNTTISTMLYYQYYSPTSFILNRTLILPITNAFYLAKLEDEAFFIVDAKGGGSIYKLLIATDTVSSFITTNSTEAPTAIVIDSCGRLWVTIVNYGIRIYDQTGTLIGSWAVSSQLYDIIVTETYDIYLVDKVSNKLSKYDTNVQCGV
ncbi:unnamed protein product [Didymodactylos carnosus]|uniref:Uncharacterized protein n=1 Tax=Didymodactylos carnosus TaxID=1234261 RepID=A0A815RZB5_9BILA|nr:unnamed protein product [Didymodactylos carnosus]CAF1485059.1 unnamed protein product [Didymodactylos carnosus]CAF3980823.1 unnamed protein product [Didymodactylos carnosus]CAF4349242.1 unnamed protein product [Didymodactylos carnosus]